MLFDSLNEELWKRKVEQLLQQHHADLIRILRELERPRSWFGLMPHAADAFAGVTAGRHERRRFLGRLRDLRRRVGQRLDPSSWTARRRRRPRSACIPVRSGWADSGDDVTVTNRDDAFAAKSGERLVVYETADGEYRPLLFPPMLRIGKTDADSQPGRTRARSRSTSAPPAVRRTRATTSPRTTTSAT